MSLTTRVGLLAGASAFALTGVSVADSPAGAQDYEARIADLEAQVARLGGDNWLTDERAEEVRALVQDVLADADTRASLLQGGMTAGYNHGFVIGNSDGSFSLKLNGEMQFRFIYNNQDDGVDPVLGDNTEDSNRWGFENTRTRLIFSGNVAGPDWGYYIDGGFQRGGGSFDLLDAWISYDAGEGWTVIVGQYKSPFNREFLVGGTEQLAIERSNVSYWNGIGRTQGVMVEYHADKIHAAASFDDGGAGLTNAGLNTTALSLDTEVSISGRFEYLFSGNWDQFHDFTSKQGSERGIMAGVGFHYDHEESGTAGPAEVETIAITGDVSFEMDGWNAFASINWASFDNDASGAAGLDFDTVGIVVQGGYYFTETLEGFLRYEWNDFDNFGLTGPGTDVDDLSILTFGINQYYSEHMKASLDLGFAFDAVPVAADITGARVDMAGEDGQFVLRSQLQLTF